MEEGVLDLSFNFLIMSRVQSNASLPTQNRHIYLHFNKLRNCITT